MLSSSREQLQNEGYCILKDVVSNELLSRTRDCVYEAITKHADLQSNKNQSPGLMVDSDDYPELSGIVGNPVVLQSLNQMGAENDVSVFYPALNFCTDNGAMIALAGHYRLLAGQSNENYEISIKPRWSLEELLPV